MFMSSEIIKKKIYIYNKKEKVWERREKGRKYTVFYGWNIKIDDSKVYKILYVDLKIVTRYCLCRVLFSFELVTIRRTKKSFCSLLNYSRRMGVSHAASD